MRNNCYYVAGKNASFTDNRPGSFLLKAGLEAWKTHINGENGTIEVDPSLNADYMPANPQCADMGILCPLVLNDPTGITAPRSDFSIQVYPNPTTGELRVMSDELRVMDIQILDVYGRKQLFTLNSSLLTLIDISHLPSGVYFINLTTETGNTVRKIIKE
jgi:hypothetical protein